MKLTVLCLLYAVTFNTLAQTKPLPTVRTKNDVLVMYIGGERGPFNGVNEIPRSFSYDFGLDSASVPFVLVSEKDSIILSLRYSLPTDFRIIRDAKGDTVICHFTSHKKVKAAVFTDAYKKANLGKTLIEVPEVYELINVVFALTEYGKTPAIEKSTPYYKSVMAYFSPYKGHPAVRTIDSLLSESEGNYALLKMDSYAYVFNGDRITNGGVYDRVTWGDVSTLKPYVPLLERFAKQSNFRTFYRQHQPYYNSLIDDFRRNVDVATMKSWLEKQSPTTRCSAVKVLFSPLVGWNQSEVDFEDNGFREVQMHINFPFVDSTHRRPPSQMRGNRMMIAFTELNHSYLNPEADKYEKDVSAAFIPLTKWNTAGKPSANYNNPLMCFEEYMNYALVTLLYADLFDAKTFEALRINNEQGMVQNRGFQKFAEFDQELLRLYKGRKAGQTVADLYPAIIAWAAKQ